MLAALKIVRPINVVFLAFALAGLLGVTLLYVDETQTYSISRFWIGVVFIYIFCSAMAAGYVINDIFDIETDKINKPEKRIVGVHITEKQSKWLYAALFIETLLLAIILALIVNATFLIFLNFAFQIALFVYAKYLKKSLLIGNFLVAILTASPYLIFAYVFDLQGVFRDLAVYLALFAFLLNLLREITKDWEDMPGDSAIGARTFPLRFGEKATRNLLISQAIFSLFIHAAVILHPLGAQQQLLYCLKIALPVVLVAALHFPLIFMLLSKNINPKTISRFIKIMMFLGVLWVYYILAIGL